MVLKPRNRELLGLIPAGLLVTAGFTAIFIQEENTSLGASTNVTLNHASSLSLTYNKVRQANITREVTEIASAAEAMAASSRR